MAVGVAASELEKAVGLVTEASAAKSTLTVSVNKNKINLNDARNANT